MILREVEFLAYADLKGLEKPEYAIHVIQRQSIGFFSEIFNLDYYRDPIPSPYSSTVFSKLIDRIQAGEIWLVNSGQASDPAIAHIDEQLDEHTNILTLKVTVSDKLNMRQQLKLESVTRYMTPLMGVNNEPPSTPVEYTPTAKPIKKKDHWIAVQLLDDEGVPIPNVDVVITDYDGKTHNATLAEEGMARVNNLVNGACEVELLEDDHFAW